MSAGRPTTYSAEMAARICAEIACGQSLRKVCKPSGMPAASTVFLWLSKHREFSEQYARAQADRTAYWAEEIVEISDDEKTETQRARLKVDTRKWLMSKMAPKKFGERVSNEISGPNGGPVRFDVSGMSDEQLAALESALGGATHASGEDAGDNQG
ncbi:hypothetical protein [Ensifer canadensis]|uniref:terminase small subunit-like protein n=1 Tax=Ensifer canadensis TaxID=555315 RepID=UPI001AEDD44B|nr:hypothetical protein [Ensifer canadensis]